MIWSKIDLGPDGKAGIEARWRRAGNTVYFYIFGSDHWLDWFHHITPGAWKREIKWAQKLADIFAQKNGLDQDVTPIKVVIGGHSLGGAIACIVAEFLLHQYAEKIYNLELYTYGAKRLRWKTASNGTHYRHLGDIVPFLPPWRPKYRNMKAFGSWRPWWIAHGPASYYDLQVQHGFR